MEDRMTPLYYALHSGNLYGTERMALATLQGLADRYAPHLFAPDGPVHAEAARLGIPAEPFAGPLDLVRRLQRHVAARRSYAFVATGVVHSLACVALAARYGRPRAHLHLVHGGTDERLSYGRKRLLNGTAARLVAVSAFVRERLLAHGVADRKISVVENFLPQSAIDTAPKRAGFVGPGIRRVAVVSRLDPIKRVDLLLDALALDPALDALEISVYGTGSEFAALRARAHRDHSGVHFAGFVADVPAALARSDLLVHLCPEEPFGLAVIEAMAAGIPVLVPDAGGAGSLVADGADGFRFRANDAAALAARLRFLAGSPASRLNAIVEGARATLASRFREAARVADYRQLLPGAA
jgi:glycosyltransferase involved in cell wall biosynthesis